MAAGPVLCLGHAVRRFTLGAGPMKRASDRAQLLLRLLLVAAVVLAPAVGAVVSTAAQVSWTAQAATDAARLHPVQAVLRADAVGGPAAGTGTGRVVQVGAGWTASDGTPVTGPVPAAAGARAGDRVPIWTTADGRRADPPPLTATDVSLRSATAVWWPWSRPGPSAGSPT